jgi:acyl carrier protein
MSGPDLEVRVRSVLERVAQVPMSCSGSADLFRELGVKSVVALDLLLTLEEELGVSIPDEAFGRARTIDGLVQLVGGLR